MPRSVNFSALLSPSPPPASASLSASPSPCFLKQQRQLPRGTTLAGAGQLPSAAPAAPRSVHAASPRYEGGQIAAPMMTQGGRGPKDELSTHPRSSKSTHTQEIPLPLSPAKTPYPYLLENVRPLPPLRSCLNRPLPSRPDPLFPTPTFSKTLSLSLHLTASS